MPFINVSIRVPDSLLKVERVRDRIEAVQYNVTGPNVQALFRRTVVG